MDTQTPTSPTKPPFNWRLFIRYSSAVLGVVLMVALAAVLFAGLRPLETKATQVAFAGPVTIEFRWPMVKQKPAPGQDPVQPGHAAQLMTWIPQEWQQRLVAGARERLAKADNPLEPGTLSGLSRWLGSTGWFEEPPRVTRSGPSTVAIDGRWRVPEAVVRYADSDFWVSREARLMPQLYPAANAPGVRVLLNPNSGPPLTEHKDLDPTTPWPGEDIQAGLELLRLVAKEPWYAHVAAIDLAEFDAKKTLALITREKTRIVWGGRPSKPNFGDTTTPEKLQNLRALVRDTGRLDAGYPVVYINSPYLMFDRTAVAEANRQREEQAKLAAETPPTPARKPKSKPQSRQAAAR